MRGLSYTKTQDTHWPPPTNPEPPLGGHRSCGEWHWGSQVHAHLREHGKPLPPAPQPIDPPFPVQAYLDQEVSRRAGRRAGEGESLYCTMTIPMMGLNLLIN